ncbi:MAG: FadR/GntR family transcriptional regulator [Pelagimonas sp.]|uniref:FadR/GntR family transcriptional regulator n=1 Tax=Pelagimonas sp. TaxID=2073170 RepID=UPI003D6A0E51
MKFPELKIPNAVDVLEHSIEGLIFSGAIRPETNLPSERQLSKDIGVSRTTLRQALSRLQAKGLLRSAANGHQISDVIDEVLTQSFHQLGADSAAHLFDVLSQTCAGMTQSATRRANPSDRNRTQAAVDQMVLEMSDTASEAATEAFYDLVMKLVEANYNFFGIQVVHNLLCGFRASIGAGLAQIASQADAVERFCHTVSRIADGDGDVVRSLMEQIRIAALESNFGLRFELPSKVSEISPQERAYHDLAARICDGTYQVGLKFPNLKDLSREIGHAENAVKLAFHQLAANGLVQFEKRGVVSVVSNIRKDPIAALTNAILRHPAAVEAMFEFRLLLEEWTVSVAAQKMNVEQKDALRGLLGRMEHAVQAEPQAYPSVDIEFHKLLAESCGNPALSALLESFWAIIERVTSDWLVRHAEYAGDNRPIHNQHVAIFRAVVACDGPAASDAMRDHLSYVVDGLRDLERRKGFENISDIRALLAGG